MTMITFYCVFKAPLHLEKYGGIDHMIGGGIYSDYDHALERALNEQNSVVRVWIEEYCVSNGVIDVLTKDGLVNTYNIT